MIKYIFSFIIGILLIASGIYSKDTPKIIRIIDVVFGIFAIFVIIFKLVGIGI